MQIKSRAYQRAALAAQWNHTVAGDFSGPAYGLHAHLVTAIAGTPNDRTLWADVTECTFHGYAPQAVILPVASIDTPDGPQGVCDMLMWSASDAVVPEVVRAIVYTDNAVAGTILGIDVLPNPIGMGDAFSGFGSVALIDEPWHTDGATAVIVQ